MPTPSRQIISEYLDFANRIADKARQIAMVNYRSSVDVSLKRDKTVVTNADLEIERTARSMVAQWCPAHGFIGEELDDHGKDQSWVWALDPIDGTLAFVYGLPTFGILLSLTYERQPVIGIIDMPVLGERWSGAANVRTMWQDKSCYANSNSRLANSIVFATTIDMFNGSERAKFDAVCNQALHRRFGIDCYAYGLLASGYVDVVMEATMKTEDIMALIPVVAGADGVITDWEGKDLTLESKGQVLATANPFLHEQCLQTIAQNS